MEKNMKIYRIIFDCKTKKEKIEEIEIEIPDNIQPIQPQPTLLETALYHLCKLIDPQNDSVLDEYAKWFENEFGITYKPTVKFVTESELNEISQRISSIEISKLTKISQRISSIEISKLTKVSKSKKIWNTKDYTRTYYINIYSDVYGVASLDADISFKGLYSPSGSYKGASLSIYSNSDILTLSANTSFNGKVFAIVDEYIKAKITVPAGESVGATINISGSVLKF